MWASQRRVAGKQCTTREQIHLSGMAHMSPTCIVCKKGYVRMHCAQIAIWGILGYPALLFWGILGYPGVSGVSCASVALPQARIHHSAQCDNAHLASAIR